MKAPSKPSRPKPQKQSAKPPARTNPRLGAQTRKVLGKHYANKHGVR
ncbi:MAG TPA: hypothetical protein VLV76_24690 [Candidatus Acidoferrum sp.]|nr:hypothetical protein [Candidatus Acidoferrum sp.]